MTATLQIQLKRAEGSLLRLLGLVGRRGFETEEISARSLEKHMDVVLTVRGTRPVDVLTRQILNLEDVERVEAVESKKQ